MLEPASLQLAVATGDVAALAAAPGVGRRTASRIILELKGKVDAGEFSEPGISQDGDSEVIAALSALGYTPAEARSALANLPDTAGATVEECIRLALQQFATGGS